MEYKLKRGDRVYYKPSEVEITLCEVIWISGDDVCIRYLETFRKGMSNIVSTRDLLNLNV